MPSSGSGHIGSRFHRSRRRLPAASVWPPLVLPTARRERPGARALPLCLSLVHSHGGAVRFTRIDREVMSAPLRIAPTQLLLVGQPGPKRVSEGDFCLLRAEKAIEDHETIRFGRSKRQEAVADSAMEGEIQRRFEAVDLVAFAFSS